MKIDIWRDSLVNLDSDTLKMRKISKSCMENNI